MPVIKTLLMKTEETGQCSQLQLIVTYVTFIVGRYLLFAFTKNAYSLILIIVILKFLEKRVNILAQTEVFVQFLFLSFFFVIH